MAAVVAIVAGMTTPVAATTVGQGSVALTPTTEAASSSGATVQLVYHAPSSGLSAGVFQVRIPPAWSKPQDDAPLGAGYVRASAGSLRISHRRVRVTSLTLCGGCSLTITYSNAQVPSSSRSSKFRARSAMTAGAKLEPLVEQPVVTVMGGGGSTGSTGPKGPTGNAAAVPLGDYAGAGNFLGVAEFGSITGTHPSLATDYLVGSAGWSTMASAGGLGAWAGTRYRLVLGVPIIPDGTGGTLAAGATGAYNSYFVTLAQNLVHEGLSNAILRLGWEFNGNWFNWSVANSTDAANFAAYWRQIVNSMRTVAGEKFQFLWNPNGAGPTNYTPSQAYPGNAYVDYIGTDIYDNCWCTPQTPQNAWSAQLTQAWGLDWVASFAAAQGKSIAFPEWSDDFRSDGHGLGDDPYFINQFAAWIASHNVAFTDIFSFDTSDQQNDITDGSFPNALAAFERDFG